MTQKMTQKEMLIDGVPYVRKSDVKSAVVKCPAGDKSNPFMVPGKKYFLQTVTHYYTGRLVWVGDKELTLTDCAWIADTGRFNEFVNGKTANEVEPFPKGSFVIIGRGSIVGMVEFKAELPLTAK